MHKRQPRLNHAPAVLCLAAILMLGACASNDLEEPKSPNLSLVYGYFDWSEASTDIASITYEKAAPKSDKPYFTMGHEGTGAYWNDLFEPGSYFLSGIYGVGHVFHSDVRYQFNIQSSSIKIAIKKPGLYFLGSYKYQPVETGFFEAGKFGLKKVEAPTEKEVLLQVLPKAKGTSWEGKILARIKELH